MNKDDVPQDHSETYGGHKKLIYAVDSRGDYREISSSGWEVEEFATHAAIEEINQQACSALQDAKHGTVSPLAFHMYNKRMDIALLSQTTGLFKWRIRRHFNPRIFNKLPARIMRRYEDALGMTSPQIKQLPEAAC